MTTFKAAQRAHDTYLQTTYLPYLRGTRKARPTS